MAPNKHPNSWDKHVIQGQARHFLPNRALLLNDIFIVIAIKDQGTYLLCPFKVFKE